MASSSPTRTTSYTSSSSSFDHQPPNPSVLAMEVAGKLTRALSTLLSPRAAPAWDDLSREGAAAKAAAGIAAAEEELAAALPVAAGWVGAGRSNNKDSRPPDVAVVTTDNIRELLLLLLLY